MSKTSEAEVMASVIHHASVIARERGVLSLWTVYDHPLDFPDGFIARRHEASAAGSIASQDVITGELAVIRQAMQMCGLFCMPRADADDRKIVETWI